MCRLIQQKPCVGLYMCVFVLGAPAEAVCQAICPATCPAICPRAAGMQAGTALETLRNCHKLEGSKRSNQNISKYTTSIHELEYYVYIYI